MAMLLAMLKFSETEANKPATLQLYDQEYESMAELKKHMRTHPEGFVLGESYTLVERKPVVTIEAAKQVTVLTGGTL